MNMTVIPLTLAALSVIAGIGMLWVFGRVSNQDRIKATKRRISAHIMELRLFVDEPGLIWRAQSDLLITNVRLIALMLRPVVILTLPMLFVIALLDPFFGRTALPIGQAAMVTMKMKQAIDPSAAPPVLEAPDGVVVETPAVRSLHSQEVSWRIRPVRRVTGNLRISLAQESVEKSIQAGAGPGYFADKRMNGFVTLLWNPVERPFSSNGVEWVEVRYPAADVKWLGIHLHWLIWFVLISMIAGLLLKKRMGVAF